MPIPGISTTYEFVDWLKSDDVKYKIPQGQQVIITGEGGGLVYIHFTPFTKKEEK